MADQINPAVSCITCGEVYDLEVDFFIDHKLIAAVVCDESEIIIIPMCKHNIEKRLDWLVERPENVHFLGYATSQKCLRQLVSAITFGRDIIDNDNLLTREIPKEKFQ